MEFELHTLKNGIRLVHLEVPCHIAHLGLFVNSGSRDEDEDENGIAHFVEHSIFKGTRKRKSHHILNRLECIGGDLNAYTTKEETCIYASFPYEEYNRAMELFSDLIFNSTFPQHEIKKEKDIILDEINSYRDAPYEEILDEFEGILFDGSPLGRNILGTREAVRSFSRDNIKAFINRTYFTDQMILCSVGNLPFNKVVRKAEKYFSDVTMLSNGYKRSGVTGYIPHSRTEKRNSFQTHCVTGNRAYDTNSRDVPALSLLNNILGGPGMNSKLNMSIREKHGLSYHIESGYSPYSDTGAFYIYLGTENGSLHRAISLVHKEMDKLKKTSLGDFQLKRAKQQYKGQIAIAFESNLNRMLAAGKSMLVRNEIKSLDEIYALINKVDAGEILRVANDILDIDSFSTLIYKSEDPN